MDIYHTAQQAKIDVRLTLNAHGIKRTGQPLLLSLLVRNLLDNAVRYSPQGSVIDVTLNADNFIVRDNGPGVTPEALARIGERFLSPRTNRYRQWTWAIDCPANRQIAWHEC